MSERRRPCWRASRTEMTAVVDDAMGTEFADNGEIRVLLAIQGDVAAEHRGARGTEPDEPAGGHPVRQLAGNNGPGHRRSVGTRWSGRAGARNGSGPAACETDAPPTRRPVRQVATVGRRGGQLARWGARTNQSCRTRRDASGRSRCAGAGGAGDHRRCGPARWGRPVAPRQRVALISLASHSELRPSQLMDTLGLTSGGVTYLVDQLAAAGFVRRRYGDLDSDRRAVTITITPSGLTAVSGVYQGIAVSRGTYSAPSSRRSETALAPTRIHLCPSPD